MKTMHFSPEAPCPCGRTAPYRRCCGALHAAFEQNGALSAPDAEALMRSRYCAFVLDLTPYLLATWHPDTRPAYLEANERGLRWLGLEVKHHAVQDSTHATVEFVARSKLGGRAHRLHEVSRFEKVDGAWLYRDGDLS
jgi:SEC-C motif domain protein